MLLIIGIKEGARIAAQLSDQGYPVRVLAMNALCREQMRINGLQECLLDEQGTEHVTDILSRLKPQVVIDASTEYSSRIRQAIQANKKPIYIRYLREELQLSPSRFLFIVNSFSEAIDKIVAEKARSIFLTTGSYGLEQIANDPRLKQTRIVARVLPDWKIIKKCQDYGISSRDIVALQGPFSVRMNKLLFKTYNADLVVSRDSGTMGGLDNKIAASEDLKIPIIVIKRELSKEHLNACGYEQLIKILDSIKGEII